MAVGYKGLRRVHFNIEGTPGTKPTINKMLMGSMGFNPEVTWYEPDEDTGKMSRFTRRTKVGERTSLAFEGAVTFEQIIYFLACCVRGSVTPTNQEAGREKWDFEKATGAASAPDTMSLEVGDSAQAWDIPYAFVTGMEIAIAMNAPLMLRADMVGRPMTKLDTFAVIAPPDIQDVPSSVGILHIDDTWNELGNTAKSSLLISGTIRIPGVVPVDYADGILSYGGYSEPKNNLELDLTLVLNADAITEYDAFHADTARMIALTFKGAALGADYYYFRVYAFGRWQSWSKIAEHEGLDVVTAKFVSQYDPTSTKEYYISVTNAEATLTGEPA